MLSRPFAGDSWKPTEPRIFRAIISISPIKDRRVPPPVACESETATQFLQAAAQRLEFVVIGFLKGKSAIAVARLGGAEQNFTGEHLWARGYAVSMVGFELEQIGRYIREQEEVDGSGGRF